MKPRGPFTAGVVLFAGLFFASLAPAQLPWRWFGPKTPDKNPADNAPLTEPRRVIEVNVEIAWLADPVTFPYYLEAHVNTHQQLEVRGYVPNKVVREHALRTAQVYSSLTVLDSMKEHPSLLVRPSQMSPQQLQSSVLSSLRAALPKQYQLLKTDCSSDGKVYVFGPVNSYEEKIAVSHSLRRLHGCTSVQNMTTLAVELTQNPAKPSPEKTPMVPEPDRSRSWLPWPVAKTTKQEPPLADPPAKPTPEGRGPILVEVSNQAKDKGPDLGVKNSSAVIRAELPTLPMPSSVSPAELQKRIQAACPKARNIIVTFTSATEVRIVIDTLSADDINAIAERIFGLPELQNYRPDLQFKIGSP
jgi:hypothetical protein